MKNIVCYIALLIICFIVFTSCNDIPPTEIPTPAETSPLTEEELEHLRALRMVVHEHMADGDWCTFQRLEAQRARKKENPNVIILDEAFREVVTNDPNRDYYHSLEIVENLQKGMFVNEVYDILGRPHGTSYISSDLITDTYTAYVLENGQVLLLRFIQASIKDYSREELESRIPNFNEKDWEVRYTAYLPNKGWFKLQEVFVLEVEKFQTVRTYVSTPEEELPEEYKNGGGIKWHD